MVERGRLPGVVRLGRRLLFRRAVLIRWLAEILGYPEGADGDLTSGGSIAALSATVPVDTAMPASSNNALDWYSWRFIPILGIR